MCSTRIYAAAACLLALITFGSSTASAQMADTNRLPASPPQGSPVTLPAIVPIADDVTVFPHLLPPPPFLSNERHIWTEFAPPRRDGHTMVHDSRRDRFLTLGGNSWSVSAPMWELRVRPTIKWARLETRGDAPAWPHLPAVYDPERDRLLVYEYVEGNGGSSTARLRALPLGPSGGWGSVDVGGPLPARRHAAIARDPRTGHLYIFGGSVGAAGATGVWRVDPAGSFAPHEITATGTPPGRTLASTIAFDFVSDRLYVIDDRGTITALALGPLPAWADMPQPASYLHYGRDALLYDSHAGELLEINTGGDVWAFAIGTGAWRKASGPGPQYIRYTGFAALVDDVDGRILYHGGFHVQVGVASSELLSFDLRAGGNWQQIGPATAGHRQAHVSFVDPARDRLITVGGGRLMYDHPGAIVVQSLDDEMAGMEVVDPAPGPYPKWEWGSHSFLDSSRDQVWQLIWTTSKHELWSLTLSDPPVWTQVVPAGSGPKRVTRALFDDANDRIVAFVQIGYSLQAEAWELKLHPVPEWRQLDVEGALQNIGYGSITLDKKRGQVWHVWLGDLLTRLRFEPGLVRAETVDIPGGDRYMMPTMDIFDEERQEWLGFDRLRFGVSISEFSALTVLDVSGTPAWSRRHTEGMPPWPRYVYSIAHDRKRHRAILHAGYDDEMKYFNETYALTLRGIGSARRASSGEARVDSHAPRPGGQAGALRLSLAPDASSHGALVAGPLLLQLASEHASPVRVELFDVLGRRVAGRQVTPNPGDSIDIRLAGAGSLSAGIYFVRAHQDDQTAMLRVVIVR